MLEPAEAELKCLILGQPQFILSIGNNKLSSFIILFFNSFITNYQQSTSSIHYLFGTYTEDYLCIVTK